MYISILVHVYKVAYATRKPQVIFKLHFPCAPSQACILIRAYAVDISETARPKTIF